MPPAPPSNASGTSNNDWFLTSVRNFFLNGWGDGGADEIAGSALFESLIAARVQAQMRLPQTDAFTSDSDCDFLDNVARTRVRSTLKSEKEYRDALKKKTGDAARLDLVRKWLTEGSFMKQAFSSMLVVGTLGGGFTFTVIFGDPPEPRLGFSKDYVQKCVAASWLLFILSVAAAAWSPVTIGLARRPKDKLLAAQVVVLTAMLVSSLIIGAFLASAEAVRAYQGALGIATLVLIGLTGAWMLTLGVAVFM